MPTSSLVKTLRHFGGVESCELEAAEIDLDDGGVLPATITLTFSPDATGLHALEFVVWALGDMERAGANLHHHLHAPPPWLNEPGRSLQFTVYVNPRSDDVPDQAALAEVAQELEEMAAFLAQVHEQYWPQCQPTKR